MAQLAPSVEQLRAELRARLDSTGPTQRQINRLLDRVAELLLRALWDEEHPLTTALKDLEARVELDQTRRLYRDTEHLAQRETNPSSTQGPNPSRHLFMPQPGSGDAEARRLWKLQLLLQAAARSPTHGGRLAERLLMSYTTMTQAANEAARASSVAMWSSRQYLQFLEQALSTLNHKEVSLPFRLKQRTFIHQDGQTITLSPQETIFLRLLAERAGRPVNFSEFHDAGIAYPTQVKSRLEHRLQGKGVELRIGSRLRMYILPTCET